MSTRQGPSAAALGTAILLVSSGGAMLAAAAGSLLYRTRVGARLGFSGDVVATAGAVLALCGLVAVFLGYWVSRRSTR